MAPEDERGGGEKEMGNLKKEVPVRERVVNFKSVL